MRSIYADCAATAPLRPEAKAAVEQWMATLPGNPSSIHHAGVHAREAVETARKAIAQCVGCHPGEVIFTSGGTEANNLAIIGGMLASGKKHIITSAIEHPAVLQVCRALEKFGIQTSYAPVDEAGCVDVNWIADAITEDTGMIAVMAANNETGVLQPIEPIGALAREKGIPFFSDAVQGIFWTPVWEYADLMSVSGHKLGGPIGTGFLVRRGQTPLSPILYGGGQEKGYRSGTENAMGITAMAAAAKVAAAERQNPEQLTQIQKRLVAELAQIPHSQLITVPGKTVPGTVSVCFDHVNGNDLVQTLSSRGICASSSSACASGAMTPSHVLLAMGIPAGRAAGALRLSFGFGTTQQDADYVVQQLRAAVSQLRNQDPMYLKKFGRC